MNAGLVWPPAPDPAVVAALESRRRRDEVVSRLTPMTLDAGRWWDRDHPWPAGLAAGVLEPSRGYRFGPENPVLARLLDRPAARVLDLGAGSGSLLLVAAWLLRPQVAVGVERQPTMAERLARTLDAHATALASEASQDDDHNAQRSHAPVALHVVTGDLRDAACRRAAFVALGGAAELVVANPPFYPAGWGRSSKHADVHASTHALYGDAGDFLAAARDLSSTDATAWVLYDAARVAEVLAAADASGWRVRSLHWLPDRRPAHEHVPFRVWVEFAAVGATSGWLR